jgi:hypothetical protein
MKRFIQALRVVLISHLERKVRALENTIIITLKCCMRKFKCIKLFMKKFENSIHLYQFYQNQYLSMTTLLDQEESKLTLNFSNLEERISVVLSLKLRKKLIKLNLLKEPP